MAQMASGVGKEKLGGKDSVGKPVKKMGDEGISSSLRCKEPHVFHHPAYWLEGHHQILRFVDVLMISPFVEHCDWEVIKGPSLPKKLGSNWEVRKNLIFKSKTVGLLGWVPRSGWFTASATADADAFRSGSQALRDSWQK